MAKLKCWLGNLDGTNEGLVKATSKKKAVAIARTSLYGFNNYWSEVEVLEWVEPGVLYKRSYDISRESWKNCLSWTATVDPDDMPF